jgi:hypothetical protein
MKSSNSRIADTPEETARGKSGKIPKRITGRINQAKAVTKSFNNNKRNQSIF